MDSVGSWSVSNVIVNAHRKRIRILEHHTDPLAQMIHIHITVNVFVAKKNRSLNLTALHQIIHPVQGL